jgi:hypothetical protein
MDFTSPDINIDMIKYEMLPYALKAFTDVFSLEDYVILVFHGIALPSYIKLN